MYSSLVKSSGYGIGNPVTQKVFHSKISQNLFEKKENSPFIKQKKFKVVVNTYKQSSKKDLKIIIVLWPHTLD